MNPDVDRAAGLVVTRLGLVGSKLEELQGAAASADTVDDLPRWALNVLNAIAVEHAGPPAPEPIATPGQIDYSGMDDDERFWTEVGERMAPSGDGMTIAPPPRGPAHSR